MIIFQRKGFPIWCVCMLYILHASLSNSTASLTDEIALQRVSEAESYKWRIAKTLQMVLWSAGAILGGYVSGRWSMAINFYMTGAIQFCASISLLTLYASSPENDCWDSEDAVQEDPLDPNEAVHENHDCDGRGGVSFQDCISDSPKCKERHSSQTTSPGISETTSDTNSMTSSDQDVASDASLSSFVSTLL